MSISFSVELTYLPVGSFELAGRVRQHNSARIARSSVNLFVTHCVWCRHRMQHAILTPTCKNCNRQLDHASTVQCPHSSCKATIKVARLLEESAAREDLACPKCGGALAADIPLHTEPSMFWQFAVRAAVWIPAWERQLRAWQEVERRQRADYELWASECQRLQDERNRLAQGRAFQDAQLGDAIRGGSGLGAMDYVLVRHRRVWSENAIRLDSVIREQYLNIASRTQTRAQRLREFNDAAPGILVQLASWERIEIRPDLHVERLARIAPHDQSLFAGRWFAEGLMGMFVRHLDWKESHPVDWFITKEQFADHRERGIAFEHYLKAELERVGFDHVEITKTSGDYGADVLAVHGSRRIIIQAKSYAEKVGLEAVQQVQAAKAVYHATEAWVVTDSEFTPNARVLAAQTDVRLLDKGSLDSIGHSLMAGHLLTVAEASTPSTAAPVPPIIAPPIPIAAAEQSDVRPEPQMTPPPLPPPTRPVEQIAGMRVYARYIAAAALVFFIVGSIAVRMRSATLKSAERDALAEVDKWAATTKTLDIDGQLSCYAPVLNTFYRLKNVPLDQVAANKRSAFRRFSETRTYRLRNVSIEHLDNSDASIVFDKDWDFREPKVNRRFTGSGRQRLTLHRFEKSWLITGEDELAVYTVTGSVVGK
jgi:hypothetical protein